MKIIRFCLIGLILLVFLVACTAYDHDTPDTEANLAGFERHFGFEPPDDVTDVYYYADEMGADVLYQLGFAAGPETVDRIVAALELVQADATARRDFKIARDDLPWWDEADIEQATFYQKANDKQDYRWALWYSKATGRVYYLEYSQ
ncbi:MAG: hypothetical protein JXA21_25685 [Anaerolineae bacterium]|nr:hypothetical protein [Anaerolineae bacterium]